MAKDKKVLTLRERFATADEFKNLCKAASFEPSIRQFSRFLRKKGLVYRTQVLKEAL